MPGPAALDGAEDGVRRGGGADAGGHVDVLDAGDPAQLGSGAGQPGGGHRRERGWLRPGGAPGGGARRRVAGEAASGHEHRRPRAAVRASRPGPTQRARFIVAS